MDLTSNTVLITGGATGIGFALAERFLRERNEVIICGRREEALDAAKRKHPELKTRVYDVGKETQRVALHKWATKEFPRLNVLVNNAGIQRRVRIAEDKWKAAHEEIAINFEAPVHLTTLFLPHLARQGRPAILNVTSGLAFAPMAGTPVYSATKAALHSFTLSLRHQLSPTPIQVINPWAESMEATLMTTPRVERRPSWHRSRRAMTESCALAFIKMLRALFAAKAASSP